jgi:hypothetical protein
VPVAQLVVTAAAALLVANALAAGPAIAAGRQRPPALLRAD